MLILHYYHITIWKYFLLSNSTNTIFLDHHFHTNGLALVNNHPIKAMKSTIVITAFMLLFSVQVSGQQVAADTLDYASMSLEELMNVQITVASTKALSARQSPGVVTLVTSEQIRNTGARDLIDVLRLVPGFEFGVDVQGVVGLGMRGNWGHEGKILILLDGQEMNERLYATSQVGHHFPLAHIDRIEIIRGPGSAVYGGYAELGVINIITKKGSTLKGGAVSGTYGMYEKALGRADGSFMLGNERNGLMYDLKGFYQAGNRSDRTYTDIYGDSYSMNGNSSLQSTMLNAGVSYKGFETRVIYENYVIEERDLFDVILPQAIDMSFQAFYTYLKYKWVLSENTTLTPRFRYKKQLPWKADDDVALALDEDYPGAFYDKAITQLFGSVLLSSDVSEKFNLIAGVDYYTDNAETFGDNVFELTNSNKLSIYNYSIYGQALAKLDFANLTFGARYNNNELFGAAFVPRFGITKVVGDFHAKFLFSQAFRAPSVENIDAQPDINPELTTVFEFETGYKLTDKMHLNANVFSIRIHDPIVYYYDSETEAEGYDNFGDTGTMGFELEYQYVDSWGSIGLNYSSFSAGGNNRVESYEVPGRPNDMLGFSRNKINGIFNFKVGSSLNINTTITYLGKRYGFATVDVDDEPVLSEFDSELFLNVYLNYKNLFTKGFNAGIGVYNLTNTSYMFIQPYNSGHAPLPASGREFLLRLTYNFNY
jgi:outer membrane receptor for ferrienterochelin and colicin